MNILLSSVGRRSYLPDFFRRSLDEGSLVVGTNSLAETSGMLACDRAEVVPVCTDRDFISAMLNVCQKYQIKLLFSLHDLEAPFLAARRDDFHAIGTRLIISDSSFLNVCLNKSKTVLYANEHLLNVPQTFNTLLDALEALRNGKLNYPLVVKPSCGFASIGLYFAENETELKFYWNKSIELLKKTLDIYHFDDVNIDNGVIIQEMILGDEYGLDIVNDLNGCFVTTFVEKKLGMRSGETDAAVVVDSPMLFELEKQIGSQSGHIGNLDIDVIVREQVSYIIEMNPRFGGHYPFAHLAGAKIPAALLAWTAGNEPNKDWFKVQYGF